MDRLKEVEERRDHLVQGGGAEEAQKQHGKGKLTARERIANVLDPGSFQELDLWTGAVMTGLDTDKREFPADAVVTGTGKIHGRPVCVYAHDFTVAGGTFGRATHHKMTRTAEKALELRIPYVQIVDSGGERIQEHFSRPAYRPQLGGFRTVGGTWTTYSAPGQLSGVVPQITLSLGPMYAGSAYIPTMADFVIMQKKTSFMSVASPALLKSVTSADVTQEEIGGAELHATTTGTADFLAESDEEATKLCRELVSYIPLNFAEKPPVVDLGDDPNREDEQLLGTRTEGGSPSYDMHKVISSIVDKGQFLELQKLFAKSLIIGLARLNGRTVGIVANNPAEEGGRLTLDTCDKQARFIRWCDAFNVPIVFLIDTPGFLTDVEQEQSMNGLLRTAPKPVFAICEASVPMVAVHIGKCFGIARLIMGTLRMGIDVAFSWPTAEVARISPEEAVEAIFREEIASAKEPDNVRKDKLAMLLKGNYDFPYQALKEAMVNEIIDPWATRPVLIRTLETLASKTQMRRPSRKHTLPPQ